jgi:hypothetical protein
MQQLDRANKTAAMVMVFALLLLATSAWAQHKSLSPNGPIFAPQQRPVMPVDVSPPASNPGNAGPAQQPTVPPAPMPPSPQHQAPAAPPQGGNGAAMMQNMTTVPVPQDWSHRHVVYSRPKSAASAMAVQGSPRQVQQVFRRSAALLQSGVANAAEQVNQFIAPPPGVFRGSIASPVMKAKIKPASKGDWSYSLGTGGASVAPAMYPATFTFDASAAPSCTNDFAAFATNTPSSGTQPSIIAFNNLYAGNASQATATGAVIANNAVGGQSVTITSADGFTSLTVTATDPTKASNTGTFSGAVDNNGNVQISRTAGGPASTITISAAAQGVKNGQFNSGGALATAIVTISGVAFSPGASNACQSATTGTYIASTSNNTSASNLRAAINSASCQTTYSLPFTAGGNTNNVTVTGDGVPVTMSSSNSTFGNITTQTANPSNACAPSGANFTGTFINSSIASLAASNMAAAINACSAFVTASSNAGVVTVSAVTPGSGTTLTYIEGSNISNFTWGTATAGTDGAAPSATTFRYWSGTQRVSADVLASNIAAAFNNAGNNATRATIGINNVSWTSPNAFFTVTATSTGSAGNEIKLSDSLDGFQWSDVNLTGGVGAAYCGAVNPTVMWSYHTETPSMVGTSAGIQTSPVVVWDATGSKVAYVETGNTGSVLHVLRWKSGEGTLAAPAAPGTTVNYDSGSAAAQWTACLGGSGSCLFNLKFSNFGNTYSSPFYDFLRDVIYVGDDNGTLWKITGVFKGVPAIAGGAWASGIAINPGAKLTGAVLDDNTRTLFVGDNTGALHYVRETFSTTGSCSSGVAPCLGATQLTGMTSLTDAPMIDVTTGYVYVFSGNYSGTGGSAAVVQASEDLTTHVTGVNIGHSGVQVHAGAFDDTYYGPSGPASGYLYVCGKAVGSDVPTLYRIGFGLFGDGRMDPFTDGNSLQLGSTAGVQCSPLTEFFNDAPAPNPKKDWLFAGVPGTCLSPGLAGGSMAGGCLMSFDISNGYFPIMPTAVASSPGGTSGIVVDNWSAQGQASSQYYSTLGTTTCGVGGSAAACAVKRTQSGLQ